MNLVDNILNPVKDLRDSSIVAPECQIRNYYARNLNNVRPMEKLIGTELVHKPLSIRADMRTVDEQELIREWEFKIEADYKAIGQIMVYIASLKIKYNFKRPIRGVIAAVKIPDLIRRTITINSLEIELVQIPSWLCNGGKPIRRQDNFAKNINIPINDINNSI